MATTKTPQQFLTQTISNDPAERIDARVNLLRLWPENREQKMRTKMAHAIDADARLNRSKVVDYVLGIKELQNQAYAIMAVEFGLRVDEKHQPPSVEEQRHERKRFVSGIEGLVNTLNDIEDTKSRLEVAEILAREAQEKTALVALDKTWQMGWQTHVPSSFYSNESYYGHITIAESLLSTSIATSLHAVKHKALEYLGEIPDERERREYLEKALTLRDATTSTIALDVFMQKISPSSNGLADVALDAMMARHVLMGGEVLETANQAVVEKAFDIYMKNKKPKERLSEAYYFFSDNFVMWLNNRNQGYPHGLREKVQAYLVENFDEINYVQDKKTRESILLNLISHRNDVASKAIDYIAQSGDEIECITNIAQIYDASKTCSLHLPAENMEKLTKWALCYTRRFVELPDKNLASRVLHHIGGFVEPDDSNNIEATGWNGDGTMYKEDATGRRYDIIAREELAKLPREPTQEEKLAVLFAIT